MPSFDECFLVSRTCFPNKRKAQRFSICKDAKGLFKGGPNHFCMTCYMKRNAPVDQYLHVKCFEMHKTELVNVERL